MINHVDLDKEVINVLETYIHERRDFISKDIVRERRRKFKILEDKIKRVQDIENMENTNFLELRDIAKEEYEQEGHQESLPIDQKHNTYIKVNLHLNLFFINHLEYFQN